MASSHECGFQGLVLPSREGAYKGLVACVDVSDNAGCRCVARAPAVSELSWVFECCSKIAVGGVYVAVFMEFGRSGGWR
jgi:hypothetical protein